ncbi:hypothetical protein ACLB90_01820 [Stenotrophomonas sp. LGBM10]|uniref:hypothetical protein n=1 Tax=Stenotrophomonas sp. LGBM10 TaxID=3390038 RepID=UPI00398B82E2
MDILIGLLPFLLFAVVERVAGVAAGLSAAALAALALCLRDWTGPRRHCGLLELISLLLFGGMAVYAGVYAPAWSVMGVRIVVDVALLLVMLASMLIGRPFTLGYAKPDTDAAKWLSPRFIRSHYVVSGVWTAALAAVVLADAAILVWPRAALAGVVVIIMALLAASRVTTRYAASLRA